MFCACVCVCVCMYVYNAEIRICYRTHVLLKYHVQKRRYMQGRFSDSFLHVRVQARLHR